VQSEALDNQEEDKDEMSKKHDRDSPNFFGFIDDSDLQELPILKSQTLN
jgi:hypothetical protein